MTPLDTALGAGREFDFVRGVAQRLAETAQGLGDDAFLFEIGGVNVALSSDMAVDGVHFRRGWMSGYEVGRRQANAALSDLAAVAARPRGILVDMAFSSELPAEYPLEIMEGIGEAAQLHGARVWGGDTVRSDLLSLDITVFGELDGRPLRRSGARPGDTLWVTGELGGPGAALESLLAGVEPDRAARERFTNPVARVNAALALRELGATAAIDISDGLLGDAGHLAAASGVRLAIRAEDVPVHPAAGGWREAVVSGEEYELLVTLPRGLVPEASRIDALEVPFTRIGTVEEGKGGEVMVTEGGRPQHVTGGRDGRGRGFQHF